MASHEVNDLFAFPQNKSDDDKLAILTQAFSEIDNIYSQQAIDPFKTDAAKVKTIKNSIEQISKQTQIPTILLETYIVFKTDPDAATNAQESDPEIMQKITDALSSYYTTEKPVIAEKKPEEKREQKPTITHRKTRQQKTDLVISLGLQNTPLFQIVNAAGLANSTIRTILKDNNIPVTTMGRLYKEQELSDSQKEKIRELYSGAKRKRGEQGGIGVSSLSKIIGTTQNAIKEFIEKENLKITPENKSILDNPEIHKSIISMEENGFNYDQIAAQLRQEFDVKISSSRIGKFFKERKNKV